MDSIQQGKKKMKKKASTIKRENIEVAILLIEVILFVGIFSYFDIFRYTGLAWAPYCGIDIGLISPNDYYETSEHDINFSYIVMSNNGTITNCSLILNDAINQTSFNITENVSLSFESWLADGYYEWYVNCTSDTGCIGQSMVYILTINSTANDTFAPNITLITPPNNIVLNNTNVTFSYNITDDSNISFCELIINGTVYQTNYNITVNGTNYFNQTLPKGSYYWSVNCTDTQGNTGQSQQWGLWINMTPFNGTGATSCCCNLDVTTSPRTACINEKVVIAADVNVEQAGIPAVQANITQINVTVYRVENNTQVVVVDNKPMIFLKDGLWYYSVDAGFNQSGNYIASAVMVTNQTPSYTKQSSYSFTVKECGEGLFIQGVSPDLINKDELTRLAAEVNFDGKPIDASKLSNALLEIIKLNGTTQYYNITTGLQVDDGLIYIDGSFNETGVYYLNWTVSYMGQTRSAKEVVVVVDWDDKLSNISININQSFLEEIINLISENKNYLIKLLQSMEFMEEFTQEEIFLITDSVNTMTNIVDYLQDGKITPQQAEEEFAMLQANLQKELGTKLLGGVVSPVQKKPSKLKIVDALLIIIIISALVAVMIGGKKMVKSKVSRDDISKTGVQKTRQDAAKQDRNSMKVKVMDKFLSVMGTKRVRMYLAIIGILLLLLVILRISPSFTGFATQQTGGFVLAEDSRARTLSSILSFAVITCMITVLIMGFRKANVQVRAEKKETEKRNSSIEQLLMESGGEQKSKEAEIKDVKDKKQKLSKDFTKTKETKIKVSGEKPVAEMRGINARSFEPEETVFAPEVRKEEMAEKRYQKANITMTRIGTITDDLKQQIINTGLDEYLSEHAEKQPEYLTIPAAKKVIKERTIKVFSLKEKEDFYPILECMRENEHIILINAEKMLEKDPEIIKKLARQLDYIGMVYDMRIAALDKKSFAIIPQFARFEK